MYCQVIVDIIHEHVAEPYTYLIPEGMMLSPGQRVKVPFGHREMEGVVLSLSSDTDLQKDRLRAVLHPLEDYPAIPPELLELARDMAIEAHCPLAETLRLMLPAQMRGGRIHVRTALQVALQCDAETAREAAADAGRKRRGKRAQILSLLADSSPRWVSDLAAIVRDPRDALKLLQKDGLISLTEVELLRKPESVFSTGSSAVFQPTEEQKEVLEVLLPAVERGQGRFLLHGVTGSGKTEVFLTAVQHLLKMGKSAIVLVPEIALTPQMISWFQGRFGSVAAVIHSRLTPGERFDEWRRIRHGEARVIIGARSAVFAPAQNLALIVVDEEHESSYLSDRHPRYDAREIAGKRCSREGATLLLASATPSILSFAKARRGDYTLLEMPHRILSRPLPEVELIDMRQELEHGNRTVLSGPLRRALRDCMAQGQQAMLLMNRRGYNTFVSCRSCGYVVKCPNCDVSMTYHAESGGAVLRCHYCGHAAAPPAQCPACGSPYIRYFGAGTQKVEEEIHKLLPGEKTVRMDLDTTRGRDGHGKILDQFRSGQARVLIGTQMIAKGLDFPRVTLVGVIAADQTLHLPDYRSRERTFQLLTQVAGRAGRGNLPGRVIIQTYQPEDPVLRYAAAQDYRAFFEDEFLRRRRSLYPPFTMMARLLVESPEEAEAVQTAAALEAQVHRLMEDNPGWKRRMLLLTCEAPGIALLRGQHRRQVLMKLLVGNNTDEFCGALAELAEQPEKETRVWFEVNPTTMI